MIMMCLLVLITTAAQLISQSTPCSLPVCFCLLQFLLLLLVLLAKFLPLEWLHFVMARSTPLPGNSTHFRLLMGGGREQSGGART